MAHATDPMWKGVGKEPGLEIWRITKRGLEKLPEEQHGNFYVGDSYVILYTMKRAGWNVHFWLGKETTIDERGAAAIKAVELDDALDGLPVQYQEYQDHESSLFLSYFKDGIRYLQGGSGSGFNHVIDKYESWKPRLFQCKGKRNVRCSQVACERNSLNLGDVFILDCGLDLYVWMPPDSGRLERIKGMSQAKSIRDQERHGKPQVHVLDQDWDRNEAFWKVMGGKANLTDLKSAAAGGVDENFWRTSKQQVTLWRVCDESGKTEVSKVSQGDFKYNQLESKDAFILDAWNGGVFVWIGKGCTKQERTKAMKWAQEYLKTQQKPEWTQVIRVMEGAEPAIFTQWSSSWQDGNAAHGFQPKLFQCSDESGHLVVEEIANFTQEDLDGDDVMILDGLNTIFVWVGANANASEKKHANATAKVGALIFSVFLRANALKFAAFVFTFSGANDVSGAQSSSIIASMLAYAPGACNRYHALRSLIIDEWSGVGKSLWPLVYHCVKHSDRPLVHSSSFMLYAKRNAQIAKKPFHPNPKRHFRPQTAVSIPASRNQSQMHHRICQEGQTEGVLNRKFAFPRLQKGKSLQNSAPKSPVCTMKAVSCDSRNRHAFMIVLSAFETI